jgi:hypothetical protein
MSNTIEAGMDLKRLTIKDKYLSAKLMATLLPIIAGERGKDLANFYGYFRWVDDYVDEGKESETNKKFFIDRQMSIARGEKLDGLLPEEENFCQNLNKEREHGQVVRKQAEIMLSTIKDDIERKYMPRSERELRHYNYRVMLSALRSSTLLINEKEMKETSKFANFLDVWMRCAACGDIKEDFDRGLIHFPFSREEIKEVKDVGCGEREEIVKTVIKNKFERQKEEILLNLPRVSLAVLDLDIPLWQKVFTIVECNTRSWAKVKKTKCDIA